VPDRRLLALDEVTRRLPSVSRSYAGLRPVPVDRVIGTLDRSGAFDAQFRPLLPGARARLESLSRAFPDGSFPPINVVEFGGEYFVVDGHHRIWLARERGMDFIDAEVTRIFTAYRLPPDVDLPTLIHTEQRMRFLEASGLGKARPTADITFSRVQGYPELLEVVHAHAFACCRAAGRLLAPEETAGKWYDGEFLPGVAALRNEGIDRLYAYKTDADLWLWVHQLQRQLIADGAPPDYEAAAELAGRARVSWSFKRRFFRQRSRPLHPENGSPGG
jgi:hypothetical protein